MPYHPKHQPCWLSIGSTNSTYCKGQSEAEMRQCMRRAQHRASRVVGPRCPLAHVFVCWGQFTAHHTPRGRTNRYCLAVLEAGSPRSSGQLGSFLLGTAGEILFHVPPSSWRLVGHGDPWLLLHVYSLSASIFTWHLPVCLPVSKLPLFVRTLPKREAILLQYDLILLHLQ